MPAVRRVCVMRASSAMGGSKSSASVSNKARHGPAWPGKVWQGAARYGAARRGFNNGIFQTETAGRQIDARGDGRGTKRLRLWHNRKLQSARRHFDDQRQAEN